MRHDNNVKENVFVLYAQGIPIERIAKNCKISKRTIYRWIKSEGWIERNKETSAQALSQVNDEVTQMKKTQRRVVNALMARFADLLKMDEAVIKEAKKSGRKLDRGELLIPFSNADMRDAMKHELLLMGEAETRVEDVSKGAMVQLTEVLFGKHQWKENKERITKK